MADNIIHLVLARTPDSPPGTKGISMFLVPKFLLDADGAPGERNTATCVSIEHKLGIHGSPTCVMSYDGAVGWLVGGEHDGMANMFTMMNNARLSVGLEGLSIAERAYQQALAFAQERLQGRALGSPPGTASPIIEHPDVRRMLMTQRAWIDAMRVLVYTNAAALDMADAARDAGDGDGDRGWQELADLLIPLSKSLCTDVGCEMTSLALQIHGGMGYVEETGVAQHFRDARIAPIYEGTNGIQAADLVGRKLGMRGGAVITDLLDEFGAACRCARTDRWLERFGDSAHRGDRVRARRNDPPAGGGGHRPAIAARRVGAVPADARDHGVRRSAGQVGARGEHARRRLPPLQGGVGSLLRRTDPPDSSTGLLPAIEAGASDLFVLTPAQLASS